VKRLPLFWSASLLAIVAAASACGGGSTAEDETPAAPDARVLSRIDAALTPKNAAAVGIREGLAAAVLIDVSGSMRETAPGSSDRKIDIAKRAAQDLVEQFARYAEDHKAQPVLLAIYEFSSERRGGDVREVVRMGPPDRAAAAKAIAAMRADGGTPIGDAMVEGKRALDATGVSRRHLMVVTDGENTDGFEPGDVALAISRRPFDERPSTYFVAFDIDARKFNAVRDSGGLVLEAASGKALGETFDSLLRGKILIEK
jgi:hypothetical protein